MICLLCILLCYLSTIALDNEHLDENHLLCTFELTCFPSYFFLGVLPRITKYDFEVHVYKSWICVCAKSLQSCPTLCDPMDHSPPGSSVHGILQPRILEWVAVSSSRGSFWPRDRTHISLCLLHWKEGSLPLVPLGKPMQFIQFDLYNIYDNSMKYVLL